VLVERERQIPVLFSSAETSLLLPADAHSYALGLALRTQELLFPLPKARFRQVVCLLH